MTIQLDAAVLERVEQRFWSKVDASEPWSCWLWRGCLDRRTDPHGYGVIKVAGKAMRAHRVAYALAYGSVDGVFVCHACDDRACCNPMHLWPGTNEENVRDMVAKTRQPRMRGERNGRARLSWLDVTAIRMASSVRAATPQQLADAFGVSRVQIGRIVSGRRWASGASSSHLERAT